jgi:hypothetical protein
VPEDADNPDPRLRLAPSAERNSTAIQEVLSMVLPDAGRALEIASGSGQHVAAFAKAFPAINWLPSDPDELARDSICAWVEMSRTNNLEAPLEIDVTGNNWQSGIEGLLNAVLAINMVHIAPWEVTEGLLLGAGDLLVKDGLLYLYGPYLKNGAHTAPSNIKFDEWLKGQDEAWGVRDMGDVERQANLNGLVLVETIEMPANNFSLIFRKS